jgi:hypothetical protein
VKITKGGLHSFMFGVMSCRLWVNLGEDDAMENKLERSLIALECLFIFVW